MAARKNWKKSLQELCTRHRAALLARRTAAPDELAEYWPGGAENKRRDLWGWITCYANYVAFLRRKDPVSAEAERQARQRAVLDALADKPETITLATQRADGQPRTVSVYPKSLVALAEIHNRNLVLATMTDDAERLAAAGTPSDVEFLVRVYDEQTYQQRVIAWIATTPGCGLPFPEGESQPQPPADFADLHPADLFAIAAAFQRVNVMRLAALDATRSSETRPDWSVFFASLAGAMNRSTPELMRDMSLSALLASASERARAHEQAMKANKTKDQPPLAQFQKRVA